MPLQHFRRPPRILAHVSNAALSGPWPQRLEALFPRALTDRAVAEMRREMRLDAGSRVLVIGSEGATDAAIYREIPAAG